MKRLFTYGCSFTKWDYPTWADIIGVNFDEHYNRGKGGCDHTFMLDRIHDDYSRFKINPETDKIFIATTGFNRLTWFNNHNFHTVGDLYNWQGSIQQAGIFDSNRLDGFFDLIWNLDWACIRAAQAIIQIKRFLELQKINHVIFQGMDAKFILEQDFGLSIYTREKMENFLKLTGDFTSLDKFRCANESHAVDEENGLDGHPGLTKHYEFVRYNWPEYITDKSTKFYNETFTEIFSPKLKSRVERNHRYQEYLKKYPYFKFYFER